MTRLDLQNNFIGQTAAIAEAGADPDTRAYLMRCLTQFFNGNDGTITAPDAEANRQALADGEGRILARYPASGKLEADIYIIAYFSESMPGIDTNNTMIMYCAEY